MLSWLMKPGAIYDPLIAPGPGLGLDHVESYWRATAERGADDGPCQGEHEVDVAVVGAGYTGLSAAYHLRRDHGARVVVLEANGPGWGCSGRNGGFVSPSIGRLSHQQWITRFGIDASRELFAEALASVDMVREIISRSGHDCDVAPPGFLNVAHRANRVRGLESKHRLLRRYFQFETELLSADDLARDWFSANEAYGALRDPISFGLHPMKLSMALLSLSRQSGVRVHSSSPVVSWRRAGACYVVKTPLAWVKATQVLIATNGYSTEGLFPQIAKRILPVLSSIVVTRPMTPAEKAGTRLSTTNIMVDTRLVRPYYRLLGDDRIMLGCRGAIRESSRHDGRIEAQLLEILRSKFPALADITADYFWSGWVNVTRDFMPRVHRVSGEPGVVYAMGYNGSGVAASIRAGFWSANLLSGDVEGIPGPLRPDLKKYSLAALRRQGQRAMVACYRLRDAV